MSRTVIITLLFCSISVAAYGHAGHFHPTDLRISRSTHSNMQASVSPYLKIQTALAQGKFDDTIRNAAKIIAKETGEAKETEHERTGRIMYEKINKAAKEIALAKDIKAARDAFTNLNNAVVPFFHTWTGHLTEHQLTLFECNDKKAGWLQKGSIPQDPYRGIDAHCQDLKEFKF